MLGLPELEGWEKVEQGSAWSLFWQDKDVASLGALVGAVEYQVRLDLGPSL